MRLIPSIQYFFRSVKGYQFKFWQFTLLVSLFLISFANHAFWSRVAEIIGSDSKPLFVVSLFTALVLFTNALLTLFSFRPILKLSLILILTISASLSYFMDNYATMFDKTMLQNLFGADLDEASELISLPLILRILLLGVIPAFFVFKARVQRTNPVRGLLLRGLVFALSLGGAVGIVLAQYQEFSSFGRTHREVRHYINPANYLFTVKSFLVSELNAGEIEIQPIGIDAKLKTTPEQRGKPSLVILVVGETARAQNFSLNGYQKETNPLMRKRDIVNFTNTWSCGTNTAVSLPCMFSQFTRENFSQDKGERYENLMDVVQYSGINVLWRDNNTGCKGNCSRIPTDNLMSAKAPEHCHDGECLDEILLHQLDEKIVRDGKDMVIVLHQNGNHGPSYYQRYPKEFEKFTPACNTNQLTECTLEEVSNAYDNALLYTDYILDRTTAFLKDQSDNFNTAMIYMSDHGESLGENNMYLHGLPYFVAPDTQKHVPFLMWLSEGYQQSYSIDKSCLHKQENSELSHDYLFSSVLGLLDIETAVYDPKLDIFANCRQD